MKRKLTLEQRITRLEKLLNSKVKKSRKFEGVDIGNLRFDVEEWFGNHMASPNYFGSVDEWKENIEALMNGSNDRAVDDCIDNILSGGDFDEDEVFEHSDEIAMTLASLAEDVDLDEYNDDWDEDDDWDDEMDECRGRSCESRKRRTESKRSLRRARNEDIKRLPNGAMANRVSDVLAAWADTGLSRPQDAIRELDRKGILDAAVNRWYPTVDDVADAIDECWNDQIGAVGAGAAQFFIGNIGGETKCSLTLYPVSGDSRARNLILKFNWPNEM